MEQSKLLLHFPLGRPKIFFRRFQWRLYKALCLEIDLSTTIELHKSRQAMHFEINISGLFLKYRPCLFCNNGSSADTILPNTWLVSYLDYVPVAMFTSLVFHYYEGSFCALCEGLETAMTTKRGEEEDASSHAERAMAKHTNKRNKVRTDNANYHFSADHFFGMLNGQYGEKKA